MWQKASPLSGQTLFGAEMPMFNLILEARQTPQCILQCCNQVTNSDYEPSGWGHPTMDILRIVVVLYNGQLWVNPTLDISITMRSNDWPKRKTLN